MARAGLRVYVRAKIVAGDDVGVIFHDQGWRAYSYGLRSGLVENHTRKILAQPVIGLASNAWHEIRVSVHGKQAQIRLDSITVWRSADLTVDRGRLGMWIKGATVAVFDNPRIKPLKPLEVMMPRPAEVKKVAKPFPDSGGGGGFGRSRDNVKSSFD